MILIDSHESFYKYEMTQTHGWPFVTWIIYTVTRLYRVSETCWVRFAITPTHVKRFWWLYGRQYTPRSRLIYVSTAAAHPRCQRCLSQTRSEGRKGGISGAYWGEWSDFRPFPGGD